MQSPVKGSTRKELLLDNKPANTMKEESEEQRDTGQIRTADTIKEATTSKANVVNKGPWGRTKSWSIDLGIGRHVGLLPGDADLPVGRIEMLRCCSGMEMEGNRVEHSTTVVEKRQWHVKGKVICDTVGVKILYIGYRPTAVQKVQDQKDEPMSSKDHSPNAQRCHSKQVQRPQRLC